MKFVKIVVIFLVLFSSCKKKVDQGELVYKTYCAGCHGTSMQGNTAKALVKTDWMYGRGRDAIVRNIKFGIPSTEMIRWEVVLKEEEINAVADYIVAAQDVPPGTIRPLPNQIQTKDYILKVEKLVETGLHTPWGIEFIDAEHALISERNGKLRWMVNGKLDEKPIQGVPVTYEKLTGGYADIALDPAYSKNGWVYLGFSQAKDNLQHDSAVAMTKIVRGRIKDHQWIDEQILFEVPDSLKVVRGNRWGCRLLFDKAGYLFFTIGDMDRAMDAQNPGRPSGKIFRIKPDGSIPKDNPFVSTKGALPAVYTLGNRNVQGLAQHPLTGAIWATEHGPMGGDELNIIRNGANYGWPIITYGINYDGKIVSNKTHQDGMEQPVQQWTPSIAICPAEFSVSPHFPKWQNDLLVGALAYEELRRLVIKNDKVVEQELILKGHGRVRDIKTGPDGALYLLLNNPDMVVRLSPGNP